LRSTIASFPYGTNDDDADALTQALRRFEQQIRQGFSDTRATPRAERSEAARLVEQFGGLAGPGDIMGRRF
jgi:predicted DNA-binding WGR domain protein